MTRFSSRFIRKFKSVLRTSTPLKTSVTRSRCSLASSIHRKTVRANPRKHSPKLAQEKPIGHMAPTSSVKTWIWNFLMWQNTIRSYRILCCNSRLSNIPGCSPNRRKQTKIRTKDPNPQVKILVSTWKTFKLSCKKLLKIWIRIFKL